MQNGNQTVFSNRWCTPRCFSAFSFSPNYYRFTPWTRQGKLLIEPENDLLVTVFFHLKHVDRLKSGTDSQDDIGCVPGKTSRHRWCFHPTILRHSIRWETTSISTTSPTKLSESNSTASNRTNSSLSSSCRRSVLWSISLIGHVWWRLFNIKHISPGKHSDSTASDTGLLPWWREPTWFRVIIRWKCHCCSWGYRCYHNQLSIECVRISRCWQWRSLWKLWSLRSTSRIAMDIEQCRTLSRWFQTDNLCWTFNRCRECLATSDVDKFEQSDRSGDRSKWKSNASMVNRNQSILSSPESRLFLLGLSIVSLPFVWKMFCRTTGWKPKRNFFEVISNNWESYVRLIFAWSIIPITRSHRPIRKCESVRHSSLISLRPRYPVVDHEIVSDHLEELIRNGPLTNVDILIGTTADESLYFAEQYDIHHSDPSTNDRADVSSLPSVEPTTVPRYSYFQKTEYIRHYLKNYYPNHLCYYDEIQARYESKSTQEHNIMETSRLYTNLVRWAMMTEWIRQNVLSPSCSDLTFYYDLVRFLRQRLASQLSASTYVYFHTYPSMSNRRRTPSLVGHLAELDLLWGVPFLNRTGKASYTSEEIELSAQMIRYWSNFVKTGKHRCVPLPLRTSFMLLFEGNPNEPQDASVHWPMYEAKRKSYINFHAQRIRVDENFLEERFQFWDMLFHRPICTPFRWYHTSLLIGILVLVLLLIFTFIFHNTKRSRRNIKPIEMTTSEMLTHYQYLPSVVS